MRFCFGALYSAYTFPGVRFLGRAHFRYFTICQRVYAFWVLARPEIVWAIIFTTLTLVLLLFSARTTEIFFFFLRRTYSYKALYIKLNFRPNIGRAPKLPNLKECDPILGTPYPLFLGHFVRYLWGKSVFKLQVTAPISKKDC